MGTAFIDPDYGEKWNRLSAILNSSHGTLSVRNPEKIERRTSNTQHRTSNIDDATLNLF